MDNNPETKETKETKETDETKETTDQATSEGTRAPAAATEKNTDEKVDVAGGKTSGQADKTPGRGWRWLTLLLLVLILVGLALGAWYGFTFYQQYERASQQNAEVVARVEALDELVALERTERGNRDSELNSDIVEVRRALEAQAEAIADLSALDREEWLVAELEYLVRLANQRLLTEDRPQGALTLLVAADELLKSMDSADTLAVREVLAKDISALKLVQPVDREGIYSRLGALIPAMLALPAVPSVGLGELTDDPETGSKPPGDGTEAQTSEAVDVPWYERLWSNAKQTMSDFVRNHFHVRYRDIPIEPLISAEQEQWLRHDLAINLSNAQQALLRSEQGIYDASLAAVAGHLTRYFQGAEQAPVLLEEITLLQGESIVQTLPDISASREALRQLSAQKTSMTPAGGRP